MRAIWDDWGPGSVNEQIGKSWGWWAGEVGGEGSGRCVYLSDGVDVEVPLGMLVRVLVKQSCVDVLQLSDHCPTVVQLADRRQRWQRRHHLVTHVTSPGHFRKVVSHHSAGVISLNNFIVLILSHISFSKHILFINNSYDVTFLQRLKFSNITLLLIW